MNYLLIIIDVVPFFLHKNCISAWESKVFFF